MTFSATTYMVTAKPDKTCPHIKTFFHQKTGPAFGRAGMVLFDLRVTEDIRGANKLMIHVITS